MCLYIVRLNNVIYVNCCYIYVRYKLNLIIVIVDLCVYFNWSFDFKIIYVKKVKNRKIIWERINLEE